MRIYEKYIDSLRIASNSRSESRFVAQQLLKMHSEVILIKNPIIVELGVDKGQSTKIFLNAISEKNESKLISVDIKDCKNAVISDKWEFVQQDSADIVSLIEKKPILKNGIDILYVDSKHTDEHVLKEIYGFFQYMKINSLIFFDDIDSGPYMTGARKDSVGEEIGNRRIFKLLEAIFRANLMSLDLSIYRGSTGLAKFTKRSKLGDKLNPPLFIRERHFKLFWRILEIITFKKVYRHNESTNDSFLIDPVSSKYD
jgi:predicted O-methyltransferase YrrM